MLALHALYDLRPIAVSGSEAIVVLGHCFQGWRLRFRG